MQTEPTLHDFVTKLLSDASAREFFDSDPVAALSGAGLSDVAPQDVMDAIPLVLDLASASGEGFALQNNLGGDLTGLAGSTGFGSGLGGSVLGFDVTPQGGELATEFGSDQASGGLGGTVGLDGLTGGGWSDTMLGGGSVDYAGGLVDGLDLTGDLQMRSLDALGFDADALGRGGDAVTGTVASYLTDGADTFADALTDGADALSDGLEDGADTTGDLLTDGADQLADTMADPTSFELPAIDTPGLSDLPVDLPAAPELPALPSLGGLPDLGDLSLDHLPVDLPVDLPAVPGLPAVAGLPSAPSLETVQDTVGGLAPQVPLVGDLTDGLDGVDNLPFGL